MTRLADLEAKHMEIILEGVLSVQAGSNPRIVEQKLQSFLPTREPERHRRGGLIPWRQQAQGRRRPRGVRRTSSRTS